MSTVKQVPVVSVVMPVFNAEAFLAETIDSILQQTLAEWELVAVEDGSSDQSLQVLQDYASRDSRIHILERPHTGIVGARNDGIAAARGRFVAALDNDDGMFPERLQQQVAHLEASPDCVAVGAHALIVDADSDPLIECRVPVTAAEIERALLEGRNPMMQPGVLFRKRTLQDVAGYREEFNFSEDYDLFLRLSERGRLANLDAVLLWHRQHQRRASVAQYEQQQRAAAQALAEAFQRRGLTAPPPAIPAAWHPDTAAGYHIRCASDAWDGGNVATVRKHARALWSQQPFSPRAVELYSRTLMGRRLYGLFARFKSLFRGNRGIE